MIKMTTVQARENFAELINQAAYGNNRVVLTRRGKALAAVISIQDLQDLVEQAQSTSFAEVA
ncbi:MAG: type II toxin-antitoxin system Phd/YefM family antitoxin [Gammaproteobacteria bacterium]|nr:type II toxin-antitoxin system Phd/YefM family antitoxin [Gammaproteobacteria bacterium]MCH9743871.1 type II toxin-antitoxin system Phd/YefM family antitoxin [Gammaproteobacteria bacterium]